jgi:hypothetical protein
MKHRSTLERRRDRQELVYMHREILTKYAGKSHTDSVVKKIIAHFRIIVGYSPTTADCDIWCSLIKELKKIT